MFNFKLDRVNYDHELGSGASGTVYAYQKDRNDTKWCVKHVITNNSDEAFKCIQEIILGFSCDNPYILSTKGYSLAYDKNRKQWDIFMKILRMKSSLLNVIDTHRKKGTPIPEKDLVRYFYSLVKGLHYLHEKGIAHRDLKPANILLDENNKAKIADFGLGDFYEKDTMTKSYALADKVGTVRYAAPENLDSDAKIKRQDLFKADLWSLGVLLFELCTLVNLRSVNVSSGKQQEAFFRSEAQKIQGEQNKILANLALGLLRSNPSERKSLKEVLTELEKYNWLEKEGNEQEMRILALEKELKACKEKIKEQQEQITKQTVDMKKQHQDFKADLDNKLRMMEMGKNLPEGCSVAPKALVKLNQALEDMRRKLDFSIKEVGIKKKEIANLICSKKESEAKTKMESLERLQLDINNMENACIILERMMMRLETEAEISKFSAMKLELVCVGLLSLDFSSMLNLVAGHNLVKESYDSIKVWMDAISKNERRKQEEIDEMYGELDKEVIE